MPGISWVEILGHPAPRDAGIFAFSKTTALLSSHKGKGFPECLAQRTSEESLSGYRSTEGSQAQTDGVFQGSDNRTCHCWGRVGLV
jgi:hypothetical protein